MNAAVALSTEELQSQIILLNQELGNRDEKIIHLEEQLAWFKRQIFGRRSEKIVENLSDQQLEFEGFESLPKGEKRGKKPDPKHRRKPNRNGQDKITLPPDLPVKTTIIDIPEKDKICQE